MKTADFENAITDLGCSIEIVQMVLSKGQVNRCYGRKEGLILLWDELGRAFSFPVPEGENQGFPLLSTIEAVASRDTLYDLTF